MTAVRCVDIAAAVAERIVLLVRRGFFSCFALDDCDVDVAAAVAEPMFVQGRRGAEMRCAGRGGRSVSVASFNPFL